MDADGEIEIPVKNGKYLEVDIIGKNFENYDSMLNLAHFKGHPMGGFGGALKQLSIGCASSAGKCWIHSTGKSADMKTCWTIPVEQDEFLEAMADAAGSVHEMFKDNVVYINSLVNLSVDCDCCYVAEDPCMKDIGIMISTDPVAIDQACLDMVYSSKDPGRDHLVERIESRHGRHTVDAAASLGYGTKEYELIDIDEQ